MALNLEKIKARLNKPKGESQFEKVDYTKIYWKPKLGEQVIRFVPSKYNSEDLYTPVRYHKYEVFKRTVLSLKNWNEKDPVEELVMNLYKENKDPNTEPSQKNENDSLISKIRPQNKFAFQVIVRGEEEKGVRIWETSSKIAEMFDKYTQDPDYGDITDILTGTDFTITGFTDSFQLGKMKKEFVNVGVTPKRAASKLSKDSELVETWLENQTDPLSVNKKYSFDEIKSMFRTYLDPESASSNETNDEDDDEDTQKETVSKKYGSVAKATPNKNDEDDDEDDDDGVNEEEDFLAPFEKDEEEQPKPEPKKKTPTSVTGTVKGASKPPVTNSKAKFAQMFEDD